MYFSGVSFVLFRSRLYAFIEAAAHRSAVLRYAGQPHDVVFFLFLFLFLFWRDVVVSEYFCSIIAVSCLNGEYVVRFFLPDGVFLPCDHGLDFLHHHQLIM